MRTWTRAFTLQARAKLNVCLHVGRVQPNGLHEIRSLAGCLDLADQLDFEPSVDGFALRCEGADIEESENLAFRAATALGSDSGNVRLRIRKNIPLQAGLGGASTDAAATLLGIARIAAQRESRDFAASEIAAVARSLGSDVPACLTAGFKTMRGTGEVIDPIRMTAPPWGIALLRPAAGMSTADAYRLFDARADERGYLNAPLAERDLSELVASDIAAGRFDEFCARVRNEFDPVICDALPDVASAHDRLRRAGAQVTLLCGSGSTVAGFFLSRQDAQDAISRIGLAPGEWSHATAFHDGE
jgi:4-diphosphocytidyl-2-C-methyl-D-erythritol kinase